MTYKLICATCDYVHETEHKSEYEEYVKWNFRYNYYCDSVCAPTKYEYDGLVEIGEIDRSDEGN